MRPPWTRWLAIGVLGGLAAFWASAAASEDARTLLARAHAAAKAGDDEGLKKIAGDPSVDAWMVAYGMADTDRQAALRFARSSDHPGMGALRKYLADRDHVGSSKRMRAALGSELPREPEAAATRREQIQKLLPEADVVEEARLRGNLARLLGWPTGTAEFDRAASSADKVGWLSESAAIRGHAGMAAAQTGDFASAKQYWQQQLGFERKRGPKSAADRVLNNLALLAGYAGEYSQAIAAYQTLVQEIEAAPEKASIPLAGVLQNLSFVHHMRGNFRSSLRLDLRVADSIDKSKDARAWADAQLSIAASFEGLGEYDEALRRAEAAFAVYDAEQKPGPVKDLGRCRAQMGRTLHLLGEHDDALEELATARKHLEIVGDKEALMTTLAVTGLVHRSAARPDEAIRHATEALTIAKARGDRNQIVDLEQLIAHCHVDAGRVDEALATIPAIVQSAEELAAAQLLRDAYVLKAEALLVKKDHGAVLKALDGAFASTQEMVAGLPEGTNAKARAAHAELFDMALVAAMASNDPGAVFTWIERARSTALLESMGDRSKLQRALVDPKLLGALEVARDRELKAESDYRDARADPSITRRQRRTLRKAIGAAREELRKVRARIQLERGAKADLFFPQADTLSDAQGRLAEPQALVAFALLEKRARALVVRKNKARIVDLGPVDTVAQAAETLLEACKADDGDAAGALAAMRKLVRKPLGLGKDVTSLVLVPDGAFFSVPFGAVFDTHTVTFAPSATTLGVLAADTKPGTSILALGDPDYTNRSLKPLPGSRSEVEAIAKSGTKLLGKDAGEESLAKALKEQKRWRAVHIACHGLIDTDQPLESSLELSAQASSDGRLMAAEVFEMDIPCDLAVLSACQTGRGTVLKSEGLLGLTRAFMVAGAPRVICSLWKVDDQATRALMVKFYEVWRSKKGLSAAAALRQAQQHVAQQKKWRHPYYWAAWTLWGLSN